MNKERYLFQIENGTPVMLDEAAISRKRDEFRRNTDYLESNYAELVKQYPNQWVAIHEGSIVAVGTALKSVQRKLDRKGIGRSNAIIEFLDKEPRILIV